jgi:hypothetical protein
MASRRREIEFAIEVFVRGHSAGKSRTHPYEARRGFCRTPAGAAIMRAS